MWIECILKHPGGCRAEIGGVEYHFAPQPDGRDVCRVDNPAHAARFLELAEGYRETINPEPEPEPEPAPPSRKRQAG